MGDGHGQDITEGIMETVNDQDECEMDYTHTESEKDIGNKEFINDKNVQSEQEAKETIEENYTDQIFNIGHVECKEKDGLPAAARQKQTSAAMQLSHKALGVDATSEGPLLRGFACNCADLLRPTSKF